MANANHTPGEWTTLAGTWCDYGDDVDGHAFQITIHTENDLTCAYSCSDNLAEAKANADLICAAPELLEALTGTMSALARMIDKYDPDTIEAEWIGHANEAINKARGE